MYSVMLRQQSALVCCLHTVPLCLLFFTLHLAEAVYCDSAGRSRLQRS